MNTIQKTPEERIAIKNAVHQWKSSGDSKRKCCVGHTMSCIRTLGEISDAFNK